jgi:hypothetical protein
VVLDAVVFDTRQVREALSAPVDAVAFVLPVRSFAVPTDPIALVVHRLGERLVSYLGPPRTDERVEVTGQAMMVNRLRGQIGGA